MDVCVPRTANSDPREAIWRLSSTSTLRGYSSFTVAGRATLSVVGWMVDRHPERKAALSVCWMKGDLAGTGNLSTSGTGRQCKTPAGWITGYKTTTCGTTTKSCSVDIPVFIPEGGSGGSDGRHRGNGWILRLAAIGIGGNTARLLAWIWRMKRKMNSAKSTWCGSRFAWVWMCSGIRRSLRKDGRVIRGHQNAIAISAGRAGMNLSGGRYAPLCGCG